MLTPKILGIFTGIADYKRYYSNSHERNDTYLFSEDKEDEHLDSDVQKEKDEVVQLHGNFQENRIVLEDVNKRFTSQNKTTIAVKDLYLKIRKGECFGTKCETKKRERIYSNFGWGAQPKLE